MRAGTIDPTKAERIALPNVASVAVPDHLTTEALITNAAEKNWVPSRPGRDF